ncbi:Uncharacterized protein dnm_050880 [Desulfonema magnum]|uniref:Uncharacterized protein n=1 Tax=Desulfonema magnum TaxID=45655 RepID=A0A975BP12_9BACT|nr:Uncharacterized protein dnm_050880 [Desulfonema magnum]
MFAADSQTPARADAAESGSSGRIRSAKIVFLQLRKNIFRTPERTPENLFSPGQTALPGSPKSVIIRRFFLQDGVCNPFRNIFRLTSINIS